MRRTKSVLIFLDNPVSTG